MVPCSAVQCKRSAEVTCIDVVGWTERAYFWVACRATPTSATKHYASP